MNEQKLKLRKAMKNLESKLIVREYYEVYDMAYSKLTRPNEKHKQDYKNLYFSFLEYMNRKDIKDK